ncbi:MAG TPA: FUSC family protein [Streptosporangiaceae bacterium]
MIRFPFRAGGSARASARDQLMLVRRRAQPAAAYIARLTGTAVFAYLLALELTGSFRPVLAPLTALLVAQATLFQTIRSAAQRVGAVTAGVLAAVAVAVYVPFSWWVLGLLTAATLALGMVLRLGSELLEVPISAMLIFSVDSHAAATSRIADTLIGAAAGLAAGLLFAPMRIQSAKEAIGDLTRQMSDLLGEMAAGLADVPEPRRATEWLETTRALRGEIERLDEALGQAEESIRLNPRRLLLPNPAAGLREGVDTLERAATDMRVLARSVADSVRIDSEDSPVRDDETRAQLAAVLGELSAAVRAYGQLVEAGTPAEVGRPSDAATPPVRTKAVPAAARLQQHLAEARRRQDDLDHLLRTDPEERPDGWPLRGEILNHVDRLRSELEPTRLGATPGRPPYRSDSTGPMRALGRRVRPRRAGSAKRTEKGSQVRR